MMRTSLSLRLLCSLAIVAAMAAAATLRTPVAAQARERTLFVSAVDEQGDPVPGLDADAFIVREDGTRREVLRVSEASEPIDLVLLVDNSSAASTAIPFMRDALTQFVEAIGPAGRFTLVGLADRPTVLVRHTGESRLVTDAIGRLFPTPQSGMTLLDALAETSQGLDGRSTTRAVIVAVTTDGVEFTNRYSRDVIRLLEQARAPLHAVTIGRFDLSHEHAHRERGFVLEEGTRVSGGQWTRLLTPHALHDSLQRLARELTSQYAVVYARPQTLIPPERVEISSARSGVRMRGAPARGDTGV